MNLYFFKIKFCDPRLVNIQIPYDFYDLKGLGQGSRVGKPDNTLDFNFSKTKKIDIPSYA